MKLQLAGPIIWACSCALPGGWRFSCARRLRVRHRCKLMEESIHMDSCETKNVNLSCSSGKNLKVYSAILGVCAQVCKNRRKLKFPFPALAIL